MPSYLLLTPLALAVLVSGCAAPKTPERSPMPLRTARSAATPQPMRTREPVVLATRAPLATPVARRPEPVKPQVVARPPEAAPAILNVHLSSTTLRAGDRILGTVRTTSNVASLEARVAAYSINLTKTAPGTFKLLYQVPDVPFFLRGKYALIFVARNARGDHVSEAVPIDVR